MSWNASPHADLPIIDMCYSGVVTALELKESFYQTFKLIMSEGISRIRVDCTALGEGGHSIFDLYFLADLLAMHDLGVTLKEAIILPALPQRHGNIEFWHIACLNRGIRVQLFTDHQAALEWLLEFA